MRFLGMKLFEGRQLAPSFSWQPGLVGYPMGEINMLPNLLSHICDVVVKCEVHRRSFSSFFGTQHKHIMVNRATNYFAKSISVA